MQHRPFGRDRRRQGTEDREGTFAGAIPSVFQWNHALIALLVMRAVGLPLKHGTAPISPFFYALYGIVH